MTMLSTTLTHNKDITTAITTTTAPSLSASTFNDQQRKHAILETLGITQWVLRPTTSTSIINTNPVTNAIQSLSNINTSNISRFHIVSHKPIFCAKCLVLLSENPYKISKQEQTMLMGMLKVLNLSDEELSVAWLEETNNKKLNHKDFNLFENLQIDSILTQLQYWAPYSILMLGKAFFNLPLFSRIENMTNLNIPISITYHPNELSANPKNKKEAYQDLLNHKNCLETNNLNM